MKKNSSSLWAIMAIAFFSITNTHAQTSTFTEQCPSTGELNELIDRVRDSVNLNFDGDPLTASAIQARNAVFDEFRRPLNAGEFGVLSLLNEQIQSGNGQLSSIRFDPNAVGGAAELSNLGDIPSVEIRFGGRSLVTGEVTRSASEVFTHEGAHLWGIVTGMPGHDRFGNYSPHHAAFLELAANSIATGGDYDRALEITQASYAHELEGLFNRYPRARDLNSNQLLAFTEKMTQKYGHYTAGLDPCEMESVDEIIRTVENIPSPSSLGKTMLGHINHIAKAIDRVPGSTQLGKLLPGIGIGAGLLGFAQDANAATNSIEQAEAVCANLAGLVPIVGDAWDVGYMIGDFTSDYSPLGIGARHLYYWIDTVDSRAEAARLDLIDDQIRQQREERIRQIEEESESLVAFFENYFETSEEIYCEQDPIVEDCETHPQQEHCLPPPVNPCQDSGSGKSNGLSGVECALINIWGNGPLQ